MAEVSDLLKDKFVSVARRQACPPAALLACWEDGTCYRDRPSDADMKLEGSAGRSGTGFGRRQRYGFGTREASPDTADTDTQSVLPVTHSHTFTSPPGTSPLLLPAPPQPLLRLCSSARSWAELQQRQRPCESAALDAVSGKLPNELAEPYIALCRSYGLCRG